MNERNLIPRIGGHHAGIPYEVVDGKKAMPYLQYMVYGSDMMFGIPTEGVPHCYQLRTTVRWDKDANIYYVQEYVYVGRNPPKETDVA